MTFCGRTRFHSWEQLDSILGSNSLERLVRPAHHSESQHCGLIAADAFEKWVASFF